MIEYFIVLIIFYFIVYLLGPGPGPSASEEGCGRHRGNRVTRGIERTKPDASEWKAADVVEKVVSTSMH